MFRLKELDQHPSDLMSPDKPIHPSKLVPATEYIHRSPSDYIKAQPTSFTAMVVSAAVFHNDRLLLVQRSVDESYANHWELPGGSAEPTDKTIQDVVARELCEETGLKLRGIVEQILPAETFNTGWGKQAKAWLKCSFIVDITDEAKAEAGEEVKEQESQEKATELVKIEVDKLSELMEDADEELGMELQHAKDERLDGVPGQIGVPVVKLNATEHQHHLWVTEEELFAREVVGEKLEFISDEQVKTLRTAFQLHKKGKAALGVHE